MSNVITYQRFWQRRDTAANWTAANPVLAGGEIGVVLGSNPPRFKIGDGVTAWNDLKFEDGNESAVPTYIPTGETFNVPADKQALYSLPIEVDGLVEIDGALVEVDGAPYSDALARSAVVIDSIADADTTHAPSRNAVFDALAGKEPTIVAGTAADYLRGDKTWRDFATDVRSAVLTGISTASSTVIAASDTVLGALGKLQAQVTLRMVLGASFVQTITSTQWRLETAGPTFDKAIRLDAGSGFSTANGAIFELCGKDHATPGRVRLLTPPGGDIIFLASSHGFYISAADGGLRPAVNNTHSLGNSTYAWSSVYAASYYSGGVKVVGARDTGWAAMTGTGSKSSIAAAAAGTASAAYVQAELQGALNRIAALEARLKSLDAALFAHGLIGA